MFITGDQPRIDSFFLRISYVIIFDLSIFFIFHSPINSRVLNFKKGPSKSSKDLLQKEGTNSVTQTKFRYYYQIYFLWGITVTVQVYINIFGIAFVLAFDLVVIILFFYWMFTFWVSFCSLWYCLFLNYKVIWLINNWFTYHFWWELQVLYDLYSTCCVWLQ